MLYEASVAVANALTDEDRKLGRVYPNVKEIKRVSLEVFEDIVVMHVCVCVCMCTNIG
jgi:hypothetical protein